MNVFDSISHLRRSCRKSVISESRVLTLRTRSIELGLR
jgi:hypothetical protein